MAPTQTYLKYIYGALLLLSIDAAISLGFVSSMVAFLHTKGGGPFEVENPAGGTFQLRGEPANLITDQGHTTNGAGGTALVLVGFGGIIALLLESKSRKKSGKSSPLFYVWAVVVILSWLLTLAALIYTFVVTNMHRHQTIDLDIAVDSFPEKYAKDSWTPENWYSAVLDLDLVNDADVNVINHNLRLMRGWRYNIIVLSFLNFILMDLVILEIARSRKSRGNYGRTPSGDVYGTDLK